MHLCREGEREQGEYISSDTGARPSMCPTTVGTWKVLSELVGGVLFYYCPAKVGVVGSLN